MKIIFYLPDLSGGGAERVFLNLMNYLSTVDNLNISLVVNDWKGPYTDYLNNQIKIFNLESNTPKKSVFELGKYFKSENPDVIISNLTQCNLAVTTAKLLFRINSKIIIREANSFISARRRLGATRLLFERVRASLLYRLADKIVVNSKGSKEELVKAILIGSGNIKVIKNSIDFDFIYKESRKELDDDIISFLKGAPYVVASGRLEYNKGFDTLISAYKRLENTDHKLIILGDGSLKNRLDTQIQELNLSESVKLCGFRENPYSILQNAELFVLSSRYEGMPNVLLEALFLELPIISTNCPSGPKEILKNVDNTLLVPVDDIKSMCEALQKMLYKLKIDSQIKSTIDLSKHGIKETAKEYLKLLK